MPIGYLDVPAGAALGTKRELVKALYDAMHEVYPFPDDTRIFLREWPRDSVSQNGLLGSEPARPVFIVHVPRGGDADAKRTMVQRINAAVAGAYGLPDFAGLLPRALARHRGHQRRPARRRPAASCRPDGRLLVGRVSRRGPGRAGK
jgi:phenylpyruvate tautomerase PptA (4-oxalocrotonate tautomerase family)